jgi:hypothetical protein
MMPAAIPRLGRRRVLLLTALAFAALLSMAKTAAAYHTRFVATYCNYNPPTPISIFTRATAASVAFYGAREGYQWAGGCWNNNDVDDSPNDPPSDPYTGGEGGDCSGFTFKMWRESENTADPGFYGWPKQRFVHGPYTAAAFKVGAGAANVTYPKAGLIRMDALASSAHIGMIYAVNADGTDQMIEAKGEAYGTNIWTRTYRSNSNYGGVRRLGWS